MKKIQCLFLAALLLSTLVMSAACGSSKMEGEVYVYNWGDYIDEEVITLFEEETGIRVIYDTFDTNESMYNKIKSGGSHYDVAIPSDYMIEKMINEDMVEKINTKNLTNFSNIDDRFINPYFDPDNEYYVPYMWGTLGIMYNTEMVSDAVENYDILWNEDYKDQIFMYNSMRDSVGAALVKLGYSLNTRDLNELYAAKDALIEQKPIVQAYVGDIVKDKMILEEGALALVYSGDAMYCQMENPKIDYAIPEGTNIWYDGLIIPKGANNIDNALLFIDFMCRPDIAAMNSEYIGYTTANREALAYMPEEMTENPIFWPEEEILDKCEFFRDLGDFTEDFQYAWMEVLAY